MAFPAAVPLEASVSRIFEAPPAKLSNDQKVEFRDLVTRRIVVLENRPGSSRILPKLRDTLKRIDQKWDTFNICKGCGRPIDLRDLKRKPYRQRCSVCEH